jgi:toxin ParE1/3/4
MSSGTEYELLLSEAAKTDIKDILRKTGEDWGEQQIAVYQDKLDHALQTIHRHPAIGHPSSRLPKERRAYSVGSHVVFYRVLGITVRVDRILHKRMNPAKHL